MANLGGFKLAVYHGDDRVLPPEDPSTSLVDLFFPKKVTQLRSYLLSILW